MSRVVILGGGECGQTVARGLRFAPARVTLVDRQGQRLHQPNLECIPGEAIFLDARGRRLILRDRALRYDVLVVAAGTRPAFPRQEWARFALAPRLPEDARRLRDALRAAEGPVVVIGAGQAGVELAAAAARAGPPRQVILLEGGSRILARFPEALSLDAARQLARLGVEVRCEAFVVGLNAEGVKLAGGGRIRSRTLLWAGGAAGAEFGAVLQRETGAAADGEGRLWADGSLNLPGHPEIFVTGGLARTDPPLDGLAGVAAQQGRYVASAIRARLAGYRAPPFLYSDGGRFAIIGRGGVGVLGGVQLKGMAAWAASKIPEPLRAYSATASEI